MFKVVTYICDWEAFKSLLIIVCKLTFVTKIWFEFGQYMLRHVKVPSSSMALMNVLVFMFVFFFPHKIGTNLCVEILGNKKLLTLIKCPNLFSGKLATILIGGFFKSCFTNPIACNFEHDGLFKYLWRKSFHICLFGKSNTWILTLFLEYFVCRNLFH
jgi:hypothetical protein